MIENVHFHYLGHAISKPIMMSGNSLNLAQSPRSESMSHGGGVMQMVVDNVLCEGSPATPAKYVSLSNFILLVVLYICVSIVFECFLFQIPMKNDRNESMRSEDSKR